MVEQQKQKDMVILSAVAYTNFFDRNGKNLLSDLEEKSKFEPDDIK